MARTIAESTGVTPVAAPIKESTRLSGLSRNEIYDGLNAGKIKGKKSGSKTLVILDSLFEYVRSLPAYEPHTPTPEAAEMIEARKLQAAEQRAKREQRQPTT